MTKSFNVVIGVLVGAVLGFVLRGALGHEPLGTAIRQQAPAAGTIHEPPRPPDQIFQVALGDAPVKGEADAKVTIVEFSDFQCPFCSRVEPTLKQIMDEYKGKVRIAWKNQPLSFHPNAMPAAEAAMAAYEQGNDKFWAMHDKLFEKQAELSPAVYEQAAREIGLNVDRWKAALAQHAASSTIQADMAAGSAVGAGGTPTFFINGKRLVGAMPYDSFQQVIDAELASKVAHK